MALVARSYEADTQQHINNTIYMDWLGEALTHALTNSRRQKPGPLDVSLRYLHIQYVHPARPGDRLRIATELLRTRPRQLAAIQSIHDDTTGEIAVECRSEHLLCHPSAVSHPLQTALHRRDECFDGAGRHRRRIVHHRVKRVKC